MKITDGAQLVDMNKTLGDLSGKTLTVARISGVRPQLFCNGYHDNHDMNGGQFYYFPALFYPDGKGNGYMVRCNLNGDIFVRKRSTESASTFLDRANRLRQVDQEAQGDDRFYSMAKPAGTNIQELNTRIESEDFNLVLSEFESLGLTASDDDDDNTKGVYLSEDSQDPAKKQLFEKISKLNFPFGSHHIPN